MAGRMHARSARCRTSRGGGIKLGNRLAKSREKEKRCSRAEYARLVCIGSQKRRRRGSGTRRAPTASYVCLVCPCTAERVGVADWRGGSLRSDHST
ncbi:hypothetical protein LY78DRAFT_4745 [Colletotrichum sublineola]|nr:hypothetical protein LY78DRAFT_4745 [Colletotrichum sublineola]